MPAAGAPDSSTSCASNTPFAAEGVTLNAVARPARNVSLTAGASTPARSSKRTSIDGPNVERCVGETDARIWKVELSGTPTIVKVAPCDVTSGAGTTPDVVTLAA